MKWEDFQSSENVEDRRGENQYADAGPRMGGAGHLGLGTVVILGLIGYMTGINPALLIGGAEMVNGMRGGGQVAAQRQQSATRPAGGQPTDSSDNSSPRSSARTRKSGRRCFRLKRT